MDEVLLWIDALSAESRVGKASVSLRTGERDPCEDAVVEQLSELLAHQFKYEERDRETFFDAAQYARIIAAAEQYYRIIYRGPNDSCWQLRYKLILRNPRPLELQ